MPENGDAARPLPEDIFNDALALPREERSAFVARACGDDLVARKLVEEMLALADDDSSLVEPPENVAIPTRLGKYEVLEERGRGGMGVVYAARDLQLGRVVALKILPAWLAQDPAARERFAREARLLAALSDERITTLHTLEEAAGFHFLTMELVEGRSLAEILSEGPLPQARAVAIVAQIAQALAKAHTQQIVHRDLKPANVMITPADGVKILDFGIAKALAESEPPADTGATKTGRHTSAGGTPAYMAPEQLDGGPVDPRCDVWSLGCVLLECLTGRRAIEVLTEDGRIGAIDLPRRLHGNVRTVLERALQVDPGRRTVSALEIAELLSAVPVLGRRRRWLSIGALALLAAVGGSLGLSAWRSGRSAGPPEVVEWISESALRALDASGRVRWVHTLPGPVCHGSPLLLVRRDGALRDVVTASRTKEGRCAVWCLTPESGRVRWHWDAAWQPPVNAQSTLEIGNMATVEWPGQEEPVIAVELRDGAWYSGALQFLDIEGRPLGTYYNPGPVTHFTSIRPAPGAPPLILIGGINSSARFVRALVPFETRVHCACLVLLAPPDVSGQAFPYSEGLPELRDWPGMPRAREKSYLLVPPLNPEVQGGVTSLEVKEGSDGRPVIQATFGDGRYIFVDASLQPLSCYVPLYTRADSLRALGKARFLPYMLIRDGKVSWHDVPVTE